MMKFGEPQYSTIDENSKIFDQEIVNNTFDEISEDFNDSNQNKDYDDIGKGVSENHTENDTEAICDYMIDVLERNDIAHKIDGKVIVDLDRFLDPEFLSKIDSISLPNSLKHFSLGRDKMSKKLFYNIFSQQDVISKEDYRESISSGEEIGEKKMFYRPQNMDVVFDQSELKRDDFYLFFWDLQYGKKKFLDHDVETVDKDGVVNMRELYVFHKIFSEYKAFRNQSDELLIENHDGTVKKISANWIKDNIGPMGTNSRGWDNPHDFLRQTTPHILERDLLRFDDFEHQSTSKNGDWLRIEKSVSPTTIGVMLHNIRYYIGRNEFITEKERISKDQLMVVELDENTAGIVHKKSESELDLKYTFNLLSDLEKDVLRKYIEGRGFTTEQQIRANMNVPGRAMKRRISSWDPMKDNRKKQDESDEDYSLRIAQLTDYSFIKKVTDDFSQKMHIGIHTLQWKEQEWLCSYAQTMVEEEYEKLLEFGRNCGKEGLRTFLSIEHGGQEMGNKILDIGEKYPQEVTDKIFAKYGEIVDLATTAEEFLREEFAQENPITIRQTTENLLVRGKAFLANMSDSDSLSNEDVLNKIEKLKDEVLLFTSGVRAIKESGKDFSLKELSQSHFEILSGPELGSKGEDIVQHMKDIYLKNYEGEQFTDAFRTAIIESFEKNINDPRSRFYLLKHKGQIVAFNCFTPQENDTVYFSNFNVDPRYAHAKLGEAMMEVSLDKEVQDATVECTGVANAPIANAYIKRGFEKIGEANVGGVILWKLRREKR